MSLTFQPALLVARPYSSLERAAFATLAYADVFDYPLNIFDVHRYMHGLAAPLQDVRRALTGLQGISLVEGCDGFYTLPDRTHLLEKRREREISAWRAWPLVQSYARKIASLPFVRMVALTGSLAARNADPGADMDYLLVTAPRRLWICRAEIILLARWAARQGHIICPNYLISERDLNFKERNFYTAHELAQMVPLAGLEVYKRLRVANHWTTTFLPNASSPPFPGLLEHTASGRLKHLGETLLNWRSWDFVEAWEMQRKINRFKNMDSLPGEVCFTADCCQGHFEGHAHRTLQAYQQRLVAFGFESDRG